MKIDKNIIDLNELTPLKQFIIKNNYNLPKNEQDLKELEENVLDCGSTGQGFKNLEECQQFVKFKR